ncbi:hypothetical protein PQX77_015488, partial [Marasmius sp. AFHP31]
MTVARALNKCSGTTLVGLEGEISTESARTADKRQRTSAGKEIVKGHNSATK